MPESIAAKGEREKAASLGDIPAFMRDPRVAPVLWQKLSFSLGLYAWFAAFALVLQTQLGYDAVRTSYFFAVFGCISVVLQVFVVGNLTERVGNRVASNFGFLSALGFFAVMPFVRSTPALLAALVLFAIGLSLTNATIAALLTDASPENARGTVLGVGSSMESISGIAMPMISTGILAAYGPPWTAALSAVFVAVALALGLAARRREARAVS